MLSYVGVGVDPSMNSFGGMINLARSEMSRDPVVWWRFAAAFAFMVTLVLAANLFADGVRDAFDPRARVFRPRLRPEEAAPERSTMLQPRPQGRARRRGRHRARDRRPGAWPSSVARPSRWWANPAAARA